MRLQKAVDYAAELKRAGKGFIPAVRAAAKKFNVKFSDIQREMVKRSVRKRSAEKRRKTQPEPQRPSEKPTPGIQQLEFDFNEEAAYRSLPLSQERFATDTVGTGKKSGEDVP